LGSCGTVVGAPLALYSKKTAKMDVRASILLFLDLTEAKGFVHNRPTIAPQLSCIKGE
jgi:hypothetical protein